EEAFHVAPQPAQGHALAVRGGTVERLAREHVGPEAGGVASGGDRELQRAPKSAVHLPEPGLRALVAEFDPRRALPTPLAEHGGGKLRRVAGIRDSVVREEAVAVPGTTEARLDDARIPYGLRGLPALLERRGIARWRDLHSAGFRAPQRLRLVEGTHDYRVRG